MAQAQFVPNDIEIERIRFDPNGMIGRDLTRRLRTLEFRARMSAPRRTGALSASIARLPITKISQGLQARVGSPLKYAAAQELGARPHVIVPKYAKALRFTVAGKVVFAQKVNHPGNPAHPYLSRWLREAVR